MLRIGLTGGIGSGKSTVAQIFAVLGIPVYYADEAAKRIMNTDSYVRSQIIKAFGDESYIDGCLNRSHLSSMVFGNKENLALLNSIVHPATIADAENWMKLQTSAYIIKEAALIFESGSQKNLDIVVGVYAPETLRIKRIISRDVVSPSAVEARINNQLDENIKMRLCDHVIVNDEETLVMPQVVALHKKFKQQAESSKS